MTKETILEQLKLFKNSRNTKYPIGNIGLFGSYARGENTELSDIDILVYFNNPIGWEYFDFADDLKKIFHNHKVDVVSKNAIPPMYWELIKNEVLYV
jgi:predicted nucleotidyltransferase